MKRSIARWTTTMVAAAMIAVPTAGYAQTQPPQPPSAPPAQTTPAPQGAQPAPDQDAAQQHLTAARNALSEMTQLPAAQQLTGEARTQVSQLISNFNELITTNADWRGSYGKLSTNLNALVGASTTDEAAPRATGTAGAVGTSGTVPLDPAIKAKLIEFRSHLEKFEKAAGGIEPSASTNPAATSAAPPSAAPPSTPPATPSEPANPTEPRRMDEEQILNHIAAIEAIIGVQPPPTGTTGTGAASSANLTLTTAQIEQLRTHLAELKKLVQK
jgi:hypothetical protein